MLASFKILGFLNSVAVTIPPGTDGYRVEETEYRNEKLSGAVRYAYEFDNRGNGTKQLENVSGFEHPERFGPSWTRYREIVYYP